MINPLVNWIWLGFGMLAFGTGIALLPERTYSFALAKMPGRRAVTTAIGLLLMLLLGAGATLSAQQHSTGSRERVDSDLVSTRATPFERQMQHEIVCTCGSCGHANIAECRKDACGTSHKMRGELAALIDQGKSHDEIIQWFVTEYGSEEMLGAPLDTGLQPPRLAVSRT